MKTIKTKLFFIFLALMISLVLSGIILNSIFLESYYIYKNKGVLISVSEKIKSEYSDSGGNSFEYADMVQNIENINTIIVDENFNIQYNSLRRKSSDEERRVAKQLRRDILDNEKRFSNKYVYYIDEKENAQNTKLVFVSKMNDDYIILIKSVRSIHQSVVIANQFYIIAGLMVIFIGAIFILVFSNKITKPIIQMSSVAENISNLQFDKVVNVKSGDEIGRLGNSINKISSRLNASINELKEDVERKKELIRNMSHELKTPIGIIKGYSEGLKYGVANDKEKIDKYCTILVEECDRMDKLVKELLNYSMMEGGMIKLSVTNFDIYELISKIIERFTPIFNENNIEFDFECIKDYKITADKDMVEKAVNNFITNAINHVNEKKNINIIVLNEESEISINVFNTGKHIPLEEMDKIWDVCYRVDKARTRSYGGHGIGLSIVKLIAELHRGTAKVENVEDGVKFTLVIPQIEGSLKIK